MERKGTGLTAQATRLLCGERLTREEFVALLREKPQVERSVLHAQARNVCQRHYGDAIFLRGLVEISSYCKNDCYYCGIRRSNEKARRYRLSGEEILACCEEGHAAGIGSFVLQGGEDHWFTDDILCGIIAQIKGRFPGCAVTLSLGERSLESYAALRAAGADRYLLRHEAANEALYETLHPPGMSLAGRKACLTELGRLGYQLGAGFLVGAPGQTEEALADDLYFLQGLRPQMVGIGPFLPHRDTPLAGAGPGSAEDTLFLLSILRLMLPTALLPATTALSTARGGSWEAGILAGANVLMPSLTPPEQRENYQLYNNKDGTSVRELAFIRARMAAIGRRAVGGRGDPA